MIRAEKLVSQTPAAAIAAGHWAKVPMIIGANNRDLAVGVASSKDELSAVFGPYTAEARKLYDPNGDKTLDELKQQVFADRTMTEPARYLADLVVRAGQPVWLYRFSYVAESARSQLKEPCTALRFLTPSTCRRLSSAIRLPRPTRRWGRWRVSIGSHSEDRRSEWQRAAEMVAA